ncbi:MBL fold metallo-hydrolase [Shimia biformata]|uniref:MBL fold metallo-hydrolase n=1 Tax=Shimia biformata TaxID=1294299 RepID=UPI00194F318E|nr:MBL fold metallo-hydrolase [Shimia biformata]
MRLTLLGTGSPESYLRRASSGYLVDLGGETIQFDCGGGSFGRMLEAGYKPTDIDRLFFSHLHTDHMMDYARLVHARWDDGRGELPVHGPAPIGTITERLFGRDGAYFADLTARTEHEPSKEIWLERGGSLPRPWPAPKVVEEQPGYSVQGEGWTLRSCKVPHAQPFLTCMGYRVDSAGKSVVYSGDSGPCDALTELSRDADILIHMCFNLSQEARGPEWLWGSSGHKEVAATAAAANVKTVILTHFRPHMDAEGMHDQIKAEMSEIYKGDIVIGEDLMTFDL